ncbi:MAG: type II secretion system protein GspM [Ramlibacter sp.]|nr:type II secretion system protein GspM [Ramlibacter sp.]
MSKAAFIRARWNSFAPREQLLVGSAIVIVAVALFWLVAIGPALATLRNAEAQRRTLDAQLQTMRSLQAQAQAMQSQPRQNYDEASRLLDVSVRQQLGTSARMQIQGERVTLTLTGTPADALARWLTQARVNARALPNEARLNRNAAGQWEGTLVVTLPPR